jgi:hypothetical protein
MSPGWTQGKVARPERLELPTLWFEARCSIQLSYGRTIKILHHLDSLPISSFCRIIA